MCAACSDSKSARAADSHCERDPAQPNCVREAFEFGRVTGGSPPTTRGTRVVAHLLQPRFDPAAHLRTVDWDNSAEPLLEVLGRPMRLEANFEKLPAALAQPPRTVGMPRCEHTRFCRRPLRAAARTLLLGRSGTSSPGLSRPTLHRKRDREPASAVWGILGPDLATVCRDDRPADCQPETLAWHRRVGGGGPPIERLEDVLAFVDRDARTVVVYVQLQHAVAHVRGDVNGGILGTVLVGVVEKVFQRPLHALHVHLDR